MDSVLEELEVGRSVNEDEPGWIPFEEVNVELSTLLADDVELLMLLRDDAEVERVLLDELGEIVLDFGLSLLVEDTRPRLEDSVGEAERIFGVELDRDETDETDDDEAEEVLVVLLLLLVLVELLLVLVELLLFLLDVLVLFLLVWILVSEMLKELDVVAVMFLVT
jgi:hypothetical protein